MTRDEMEILADIIIDKLVGKQKEMDREFITELEMANVPIEVHEKLSPTDKILMEIASLTLKIEKFIEQEQYDKAELCKQKINKLRDELKDI
jgi:hypothetical protein